MSVLYSTEASFRCGPKRAFAIKMKVPDQIRTQAILAAEPFANLAVLKMADACSNRSNPQFTLRRIGDGGRKARVCLPGWTMARVSTGRLCRERHGIVHDRDS